jgi:DUF4097 and DUF4098 domain-containing protein YvlB
MRRRSITGPLLLLLIGAFFLWRNLHPEAPIFDWIARYWPFLLIGWGLARLLEAVIWYREGRDTRLTGGEVVLVVLICIAGAGMWAVTSNGIHINAGALRVLGEPFNYPLSATAPAGGVTRVVFDVPRGNVKVTGAETEEVKVSGQKVVHAWAGTEAEKINAASRLELTREGNRLLVRLADSGLSDSQRLSADLEVEVPRGVSVESRARSGNWDFADLNGDVELNCDRGDARLDRIGGAARLILGRSSIVHAAEVKGKLDLEGRGSDVELTGVGGQVTVSGSFTGTLEFRNLAKPVHFTGSGGTEFTAQAIPGRLNVEMGSIEASDLVGPVHVDARSRDVSITQFTGALEVETQRGDIEIDPGRLPLPAITARTSQGQVELALPEKASFDLLATAERGEAENSYGPSIRQETSGRSATLRGTVGRGPSIRLTSGRGSVSVRRQGASGLEKREDGPKPLSAPRIPGKPIEVPKGTNISW